MAYDDAAVDGAVPTDGTKPSRPNTNTLLKELAGGVVTTGNVWTKQAGGGGAFEGSGGVLVADAADYTVTAFEVGTGGRAQNEHRRFTFAGLNKINFPAGLPAEAYGLIEVPAGQSASVTSPAGVTVNGVADRGGANPVLTLRAGLTSWRRTETANDVQLRGAIDGETVNIWADLDLQNNQLLNASNIGTAAALDVPASGDAASGEVVKGDDTRLTNARAPTAHAASHVTGGGDVIAAAVPAGDSGLMTGADKSKLDGVEAGATADQTAAEILTALLTVDGTGSLLDADLLDGQEAAAFAAATHAGSHVTGGSDVIANAVPAGNSGLMSGADKSKLDGVEANAKDDQTGAEILALLLPVDGAGSLLDADLLDGQEAAAFATAAQGALAATALQPNVAGQEVRDLILRDYAETRTTPTISAGAVTVDYAAANVAVITLTGNITSMTLSNPPPSGQIGSLTIWLVQDATGGRTVTWPASVSWGNLSAPTLAGGANQETLVVLLTRDGGTTWKGREAWKTA